MHNEKKTVAKCRSVFHPGVARRLLKMGNPIYDIKPKKEMPDASIFLFEVTDKFRSDLAEILAKQEEQQSETNE